jgi:tRNA A37 threonylcarbamoyladenosine modification protein TsaB
MYIAIDTAENERIVFHFFSGKAWNDFVYPYDSEDALLAGLTKLLKDQRSQLSDITGLAVRVGQGRFTATRVAVTMANTLAFALHIPVIAYTDASLGEVEKMLQQTPAGTYAHAQYSAPPSVGKK